MIQREPQPGAADPYEVVAESGKLEYQARNGSALSLALGHPVALIGMVVIVTALLLTIGFKYGPAAVVVLPLALVGTVFVARHPHWGVYGLLVGAFSLDWLSREVGILPTQARWVTDALLVLLVLLVARRRWQGLGSTKTPVDGPMLALAVVGSVSVLLSGTALPVAFAGFRLMFKVVLLFYVIIYLDLPEPVLRRLVLLMIGLELLQIPAAVLQFLHLRDMGDLITGTMGLDSTQIATLTATMVMGLLLGMALVKRSIWCGVLGCALFIPIILGSGKAGFFFAPVVFIFILMHEIRQHLKTVLLALAALAIVLVIGVSVFPPDHDVSLATYITSPAYVVQHYEIPLGSRALPVSRLSDIQLSWQLVSGQARTLLIGFGPGQASPSFFQTLAGSLYQAYDYSHYIDVMNEYHLPYADVHFAETQVSVTLLEWGCLGFLLYLLALYRILRANGRPKAVRALPEFWQGVALGFRGVLFVYAAGIVYWYLWESEATGFLFWGLAAALFAMTLRAGGAVVVQAGEPAAANPATPATRRTDAG